MNKLPSQIASPLPGQQPSEKEVREAKRTMDQIQVMQAKSFASRFLGYMLPTGAKILVQKGRASAAIAAELNQFFSARPRPWRSHQNRRRNRALRSWLRWMSAKIDKELKQNG